MNAFSRILKGTRLIVLFIVITIASVSVLLYLGITNIANYRDLLESKVNDEERMIIKEFASFVDTSLNSLSIKFSDAIDAYEQESSSEFDSMKDLPGVVDYIILDSKGYFKRPRVANSEGGLSNENSGKKFREQLRSGERQEFNKKDHAGAKKHYTQALKLAGTGKDSSRIYNALSRTYLNTGHLEEALSYSGIMINDFGDECLSSVYPYAYFAVNRILKINDPNLFDKQRILILNFLDNLAANKIPINENTTELLDSLHSWKFVHAENIDTVLFNLKLNNCRNLVKLHKDFLGLREIVVNSANHIERKEAGSIPYTFHSPESREFNKVLFLFEKRQSYYGFILNIEELIFDFKHKLERISTKFDYSYRLIDKRENNYLINSKLRISSEFSPAFKAAMMELNLVDEKVVDKEVLKRKLSFGIGMIVFFAILIMGLYLLIKDIQREKKLNKLRSEFVSQVTHELKTPLTSINMFAEALRFEGKKLDDRQLKYTRIIVKESEKLKRMINNILDFSKDENDSLKYELKRANLAHIIEDTIKEMDYFLEINKMKVEQELEDNIFAMVHPEALKQALSNLLSNAIKYTASSKRIIIRLFKENNLARLEVEDFGIGIPNIELKSIFNKFYRINSEFNESISGTGLGLTVTKAIVIAHKGEIIVESKLGKGSKFSIFLDAIN